VELMGKLKKPCPKCGKLRWSCEVLWPQEKTGWQAKQRLNSDGRVR